MVADAVEGWPVRWKHRCLHDCCEKLYADNSSYCEDSAHLVGACATRRCVSVAMAFRQMKRKRKNVPNRFLIIGLYFRINLKKLELQRVKNQFGVRLQVGVFHVKNMKDVWFAELIFSNVWLKSC
ncbi:hypothetical protein [Burkholderia lata]|uniref:hypothetical protein n=1 Tax=Burkholderia lata (strain ATCC 17760 / DSM 23089 / LMG 22485 / NCIMB 9086 / R18194 / 383) TaxID=482957 RepID=UPI00158334DC|nr:hypothetical protein [Burkholderia lata]